MPPRKKSPAARPAPQQALLNHIIAYWSSQLVFVAAKLGVADALARGPQRVANLARRVKADPTALHRVLRALASLGIFAERGDGRFELTPEAEFLRSGVPGSLRDFALMMVDDYNWRAWGALLEGVRSGRTPFDAVHGMPAFEYLRRHPEQDRIFSASMASLSAAENPAVAAAYDFGRFTELVDVGGAHGHLLATILRAHPGVTGILFDQPQVVAAAKRSGFVTARDVARRISVVGGDFFRGVPEGADGYVMKYILHDWEDAKAVKILRHCRRAMAPGGRVLVIDHVIEPGNGPDWAKLLDINMLAIPGGRERTREQFRDLFARAGLKLRRVHPTAGTHKVLEAVAA